MIWGRKQDPLKERFLAHYEQLLKAAIYKDKHNHAFTELMIKHYELFDKNQLSTDAETSKALLRGCEQCLEVTSEAIAYLNKIVPADHEIAVVHAIWMKAILDSEAHSRELHNCIKASFGRQQPNYDLLKHLKTKEDESRKQANKAVAALCKRLGVGQRDIGRLLYKAKTAVKIESWRPS